MSAESEHLTAAIGTERFTAKLQHGLAPRSCERLMASLPYVGKVIHARWSGEALWSPLGAAFPPGLLLPPEHPRGEPAPGEILLYAGELSEPELLVVYGTSRFACKAGPLEGNPVLLIEEGLERLARLGREVLWGGAMELRIERTR
ncbi:MAG TPA: DUF3830 family protein [Gammaproteobacteria bacterium]